MQTTESRSDLFSHGPAFQISNLKSQTENRKPKTENRKPKTEKAPGSMGLSGASEGGTLVVASGSISQTCLRTMQDAFS